MRTILLAAALALTAFAAQAAEPARIRDTSSVDATGSRILQDRVVVHAAPSKVWQAMTDEATYKKWAAPVASLDVQVGGVFEVSYDPKAKPGDPNNVKQQVLAYLPNQLIVFRNVQAAIVPGGNAYRELAIVVDIKDLGNGDSEVSLSQVGYKPGKDFDTLYAFFKAHNPEYLAELKAFVEQPAGK